MVLLHPVTAALAAQARRETPRVRRRARRARARELQCSSGCSLLSQLQERVTFERTINFQGNDVLEQTWGAILELFYRYAIFTKSISTSIIDNRCRDAAKFMILCVEHKRFCLHMKKTDISMPGMKSIGKGWRVRFTAVSTGQHSARAQPE